MSSNDATGAEQFRIEPEIVSLLHDMDDEEISSFAQSIDDPISDEQIELHIYACFLAFMRTRSTGDLERAIQQTEGWIAVTPSNHSDHARRFRLLDMLLGRMYQHRLILGNGTPALSGTSQVVPQQSTLDEILNQMVHLNDQAIRLETNYERTGAVESLNEAVRMMERAITISGEFVQPGLLHNFGNILGTRFERTGSVADLHRAVDVASGAVDALPQNHPERAIYLNSLGNRLGALFRYTDSIADLNRAVDIASEAVNTLPQGHPSRANFLNNFGNRLSTRFERTGSICDLNQAVVVASEAVNIIPQDDPDRANCLSNLGVSLGIRFLRTGSIDDLNRAIDVANEAVSTTPQGHPDRASYLTSLGNRLGARFEHTGSIDDLNRAVDVAGEAVDALPWGHPTQVSCLSNLGKWLGRRFERTGSMDDLNRAIDIVDNALHVTPQEHPNRVARLNNLGSFLSRRFSRTGSVGDINRAVDVTAEAVDYTPEDHPDRASRLRNLGMLLGLQFGETGSVDTLNRAVDMTSKAVDATPEDHPDRASRLSNLGNCLGLRFEQTGSIVDVNRAIDVTSRAVDATPEDNPDQATYLNNLGTFLGTRYKRTGSMDDLNRELLSYKDGWHSRAAPPSVRISLAQRAARILASQKDWEDASQLLQEAIDTLPAVNLRLLEHTDKQHMLTSFTGLASMAAAAALNAGKGAYEALRLLELGRGVIASLLIDMRGDISDLRRTHPCLADEFASLRNELDSPTDRPVTWSPSDEMTSLESQGKRRREVDKKFSELITKIRAEPGFHNFLLPPTAKELMDAANKDPIIVINLSPYRCDAFLVQRDQIKVLELPALTLDEAQNQVLALRYCRATGSSCTAELLEWLWEAVAGPCLDTLGFSGAISDDNWPRVWWVPTGLLSQLPLHAAGRHAQSSTETVLDRVMSSYAPSIKALLYGRRQHIPDHRGLASDHVVLVAMSETAGLAGNGILPFAVAEVEMLHDLCHSLQLRPTTPARRKNDVLESLQSCRIFHFAGHGRSDPTEPSKSCLLLEDWKTDALTVGDLRDSRLQENPPFLAYLSACSTGANEMDELVDEGIHLVSAFQLAGFRHVIGTLWEVSDKHCVDVAKVLYETIRDEGITDIAVCRGLHRAIRASRDDDTGMRLIRDGRLAGGVDGDYDDTEAVGVENSGDKAGEEDNSSVMGQVYLQARAEGDALAPTQAHEERNPIRVKRRKRRDMLWVPYIHFGV